MTATFIGTALQPSGPISHRGFIDVMDIGEGVRGWALDLENPSRPVRVELMAGDIAIAETDTDLPREDLSDLLGQTVIPGFRFDADIFASIAKFADEAEDEIGIRIAGTEWHLATSGPAPTVAQILQFLRQPNAAQTGSETADFDLLLDRLRADAVPLSEIALRPMPEDMQGYIETLSVDVSGNIWMIGWMKQGHLLEFSAVISEHRRVPAAVALMTFARDDVPDDSYGVIGLISSSWRPTSATSELFLFFGAGGRFHLRSHSPLRFITAPEMVTEYESVRHLGLDAGRAAALERILNSPESWMPTRSSGQDFGTEMSIDRVLLVPGLGCLVEGWIVSPLKRIEALRLRIGGGVMSAAPDALFWKPRPDLLSAFSGGPALVSRAGFVGLFLGAANPADFVDPILKIVFEGGASGNWSVPAKMFRRLGHSASIEDALAFFPSLLEEPFFPRFAEAAIRAQRAALSLPAPLGIARSRRAMVFVLPEDRCDLFLLFEALAQQCRTHGRMEGIAFVASAGNRADALWLSREFQAAQRVACSLLVIDDPDHAFALLPDILRELGSNRFVFVGAGVFLTQTGWRQARQILQTGSTDLVFLGLEPDEFEPQDRAEAVTARCFAWTTAHFTRWSMKAWPFLGGYYRDNGLFASGATPVVLADCATTSRPRLPTRMAEAVNAAVYGRELQS